MIRCKVLETMESYYLRIRAAAPNDAELEADLLIPHAAILLIFQAPTEKAVGFLRGNT